MKKVLIEVLGTDPPCARCNQTYKIIEKAANRLNKETAEIKIEKRNCAHKETISRFGVIIPPALAVNGVIKISGRIPNESEIEHLLE